MRLLRQGSRMWSLTIFAVVALVVLAACGREPGDVPTPTPADVEAPVATPEVEAPDTTPPTETVDVDETPEPGERIVIVTTPGPEEEATPEPEAQVETTPEDTETPEVTIIVATDGTPLPEVADEATPEADEERDIIVIVTTPDEEEVAPEAATPESIEEETEPPVIIVATPEPDEIEEEDATPEPAPEAGEEAREIIVIRTTPTPEATLEDGRISIVTEGEDGREPVPATIVVADADAPDASEADIIVRAPTCPPGTIATVDGTPVAGTPVATLDGNGDSTLIIECEPEP
jgi:hypothetical protein